MLGFLGLSGIKMAVIGAVVAAVAVVVGGLYWQNSVLKSDLETSQQNAAKLELAVETQKATITAVRDNAAQWQQALLDLQATVEELAIKKEAAEAESRRLYELFAKHDFTMLALEKPGLIERRINRGTADVFRVLERITSGDLRDADGPGDAAGETGAP